MSSPPGDSARFTGGSFLLSGKRRLSEKSDGLRGNLNAVPRLSRIPLVPILTMHSYRKLYGAPMDEEVRRYCPARCIGRDMKVVSGYPDPTRVSTSFVERQNLALRMSPGASLA